MADSLVKRTGLTIGLISLLLGCGAQDGADGRDGQDGQPGEVGAKGPVGPSGAEGTDGTDGQEGIPGQDGVDSDIAPPTVTIEYGPTDPSGPAATFEFSCSRPDCTFDCRLDGTGWEACSSPWFVTGLELGSHLFEVRARDGAGRDSLGEDYAWTVAASGAPMHVILIVGDGMQLAHEIAASRYLYGVDRGLLFHQFPYQGNATTWDVDTYDRLAWKLGRPPFNEQSFDPSVGYDPMLGGGRAYPGSIRASGTFPTRSTANFRTTRTWSSPSGWRGATGILICCTRRNRRPTKASDSLVSTGEQTATSSHRSRSTLRGRPSSSARRARTRRWPRRPSRRCMCLRPTPTGSSW